jgi:UDP-GlcNAc:undecaprenyl-phosphate GlcNAc-1-phosphate transferase
MLDFILSHPVIHYPIAAVSAFGVAVLLVRLMIEFNVCDTPIHRSSHKDHTPTAGGVGFILAFVACSLWCHFVYGITPEMKDLQPFLFFFVGVVILGVVGFIDDYQTLSYRSRLFFQTLCVGLLISSMLYIHFPALQHDGDRWQKVLTLFAVMGLINGANFIDGLNGLLAGSLLIAIGAMAAIIPPEIISIHISYAILFGAVAGFFIFNFPKGKIFMGDVGSTFIGFALAFFALLAQSHYAGDTHTAFVHKGFVFTLSPLMFLWFDVGSTLVRRIIRREQLTEAHREHMIHILHDAGYSHKTVSAIYFGGTVVMSALSLACHHGHISFIQGLIAYIVLQTFFCLWVFSHKDADNEMV